ncbi:MAG: PKD domain-containing protein, partial [Bacteroidetes bacterium]|nr:PKD domain-containing protein [Bacteroidota bacterium]
MFFLHASNAQSTSNKGTDFWVGYMGHIDGTSSNMSLYITSDVNTSGTVSIPGKNWTTSYNVTANSVTVVSIPQSLAYMSCSDCILSQGINITSVEPVVVYAHIYANSRSDATLVLPTETAGRDYYAMSFTQKVTGNSRQNEFMIVGIEDSTYVDITVAVGTLSGTHSKGSTYTKLLMKGQVYQVQSDSDLTASHITSYGTNTGGCKRVAVFSGSSFTPLGCSSASTGDNLFQQMYPASAWGKNYVTAPMKTRTGGDYFRALASKNSTKITINNWNTQSLSAGQYYEWLSDSAQYITSNEGICLAQYQRTQGCDNVTGDPSMIILNSTEQQLNDITVYSSPYQNITGNYINIYMQSDDTANFYIDNAKPSWKTVPSNSSYAYAQQTVNSGNHHLAADSGFNAVAYGFGNVESYGYSAGANIVNQAQNITLKYGTSTATCKGEPVYFKGNCIYTPVSWQWNFGDGNTDSVQNPSHTYADTGLYTVSLVTTKSNGNDCDSKDSTIYKVRIYSLAVPKIRYSNACSNEYVKFYDSSSISAYSITSRRWEFGDGGVSYSQNPTHKYTSYGTYTVKFTVYSTGNCYTTDSIKVTVNQSPVAKYNITAYCIQDSITLFDSTTLFGVFKSSYSCFKMAVKWGDGKTDSINNKIGNSTLKHQYASGNNYTIGIYTTDCATGCSDSMVQNISIESESNPMFIVTDGCQKDSILILDSSTISYGSIKNWNWSFGDATTKTYTSKIASFNKLYSSSGSYTIRLITENGNDCQDTFNKIITVYPKPNVGFSYTNVCYLDTMTLQDTSSITSGSIASWHWYWGDGKDTLVYNQNGIKKYYNASGTYTVKVVVTSANGCKDSVSHIVIVGSKPKASFTTANVCEYDSIQFTDNTSGATIVKRFWTFGNSDTLTTLSTKFKYLYSQFGSYTVSLYITSNAGCLDTFTKSISIYEKPEAKFEFNPVCLYDSVHVFDSSSIQSATISKWKWNWGNGDSTIHTVFKNSLSHLYSSASQYQLKLIVESNQGCRDTMVDSIQIYAPPTAVFIAADKCLNDSVSFTDYSILGDFNLAKWYINYGDTYLDSSDVTQVFKHKFSQKKTYNINYIVIDSFGCRDTSSQTIAIDTVPIPDFSYVSACSSDSIVFTNLSIIYSSSLSQVYFDWGDSTNQTSSQANNYKHFYQYGGWKQVMLKAISNKGCKDSITKNVYIKPLPISNFSLPNICYKDSVTFQDLSSVDSGSIVSWKFNFGDGDSITYNSKNNFKHKYDTVGTYNIYLKTISSMGCTDSVVIAYTVNSNPIAVIGWDKPCVNIDVQLLDSSYMSYGSIYKWNWSFGDGGNDTVKHPLHHFTDTGIYQVSLFVQSGNACKDSTTKNIYIRPAPVAKFSVSNSCPDDSVVFKPSSNIASGFVDSSYWLFADGSDSTTIANNQLRKIYLQNGIYRPLLTAISGYGCMDTVSKNLTIYEKPSAGISFQNICSYDSVHVVNLATMSQDSIVKWSYYWGDGDSTLLASKHNFVLKKYAIANSYTISQIVSSNHQCKDTISVVLNVNPVPAVSFSINNQNQCFNVHSYTFIDSSTIASGYFTRLWKLGDGNIDTNKSIQHQYTVVGLYDVTLIEQSDSGCIDSVVKRVEVYESPKAKFKLDTHSSCLTGNLFKAVDSSALTQGTYTRAWNWGDGNFDTSTIAQHTYTLPGTYLVTLMITSNHNCIDSVSDTVVVYPMPNVDFAYQDKCFGDSSYFVDRSNVLTGSIVGWSWSFGDSTYNTYTNSIDSFQYIYSNPGSYNVNLKLASNYGCVDSFSKLISVNYLPQPKFLVENDCIYNLLVFVDSTKIYSGSIFQWDWSWGDSSSSVYNLYTKGTLHQYMYDGFHQVKLKCTSDKGCIDSFQAAVQVYPKPIASIQVSDVCEDAYNLATDSSVVSSGYIVQHHWNWGDFSSYTSLQSDTNHIYANWGQYSVTLITETNYGCKDTAVDTIQVHPRPVMNFYSDGRCTADST